MSPERILLPLDIRRCPLEVFPVVNGLAKGPGATVILLHVVTLNITMAENRVYDELGWDARWYLERLARGCLRPDIAYLTRVRFGKPAEEILAEAADSVDLVVLPSYRPSIRDRIFAPFLPSIVEQVARRANCFVFRASKRDRFNCEDVWGRSADRSDGLSDAAGRGGRIDPRREVSSATTLSSRPGEHRSAA